ncbi:CRAL TRIO domain-containing protein [Cryptosporidium andersoni]|uniref:CRAL TRIO domain-containing protein n=1 Tax=Cryptosporidium andersoni TaxID=117008 RepID=A0A1J4MQI8_9CRYT|nr:CRAL TRIO domain-containing protein [Cryptosporidium andersoni]
MIAALDHDDKIDCDKGIKSNFVNNNHTKEVYISTSSKEDTNNVDQQKIDKLLSNNNKEIDLLGTKDQINFSKNTSFKPKLEDNNKQNKRIETIITGSATLDTINSFESGISESLLYQYSTLENSNNHMYSNNSMNILPKILTQLSDISSDLNIDLYKKFYSICRHEIESIYNYQNDSNISRETIRNCCEALLSPLRLYRFLLGYGFKIDYATDAFSKHINWRKEYNLDSVIRPYVITNMVPNNNIEMAPLHNIIVKYYPCNLLLRENDSKKTPLFDLFGNIICIERFGLLDETRLLGAVKVEELLLWYAYHMEYRCILLDKLSYENKNLVRATCIVDLYGLSISQVHSSHMISILRRMIQLTSDNYPEGMSYVIFVNAPRFFSVVWNSFKVLLAARTVEKIIVLDDDYKDKLFSIIKPDNVPIFLGGLSTDEYASVPNSGTLLLDSFGLGDDRQTLYIKRMKKEKMVIPIKKPFTLVCWTWGVLDGDIGFSVKFYTIEQTNKSKLSSYQRKKKEKDDHNIDNHINNNIKVDHDSNNKKSIENLKKHIINNSDLMTSSSLDKKEETLKDLSQPHSSLYPISDSTIDYQNKLNSNLDTITMDSEDGNIDKISAKEDISSIGIHIFPSNGINKKSPKSNHKKSNASNLTNDINKLSLPLFNIGGLQTSGSMSAFHEITIVPFGRYDSSKAQSGSYLVDIPGYLILQWDNSWSIFSGKTVHFVVKTNQSFNDECDAIEKLDKLDSEVCSPNIKDEILCNPIITLQNNISEVPEQNSKNKFTEAPIYPSTNSIKKLPSNIKSPSTTLKDINDIEVSKRIDSPIISENTCKIVDHTYTNSSKSCRITHFQSHELLFPTKNSRINIKNNRSKSLDANICEVHSNLDLNEISRDEYKDIEYFTRGRNCTDKFQKRTQSVESECKTTSSFATAISVLDDLSIDNIEISIPNKSVYNPVIKSEDTILKLNNCTNKISDNFHSEYFEDIQEDEINKKKKSHYIYPDSCNISVETCLYICDPTFENKESPFEVHFSKAGGYDLEKISHDSLLKNLSSIGFITSSSSSSAMSSPINGWGNSGILCNMLHGRINMLKSTCSELINSNTVLPLKLNSKSQTISRFPLSFSNTAKNFKSIAHKIKRKLRKYKAKESKT